MSTKQEEIKRKKDTLESVKKRLKEEFIGIDGPIDSIFENIEVWYIMPEVLNRPVLINLWGMTGSGKTDLVRKLAKYLGFADNFLEIQMSFSSNNTEDRSTVYGEIINAGIYPENQSIILFDEFQRFKTKERTMEGDKDVPNLPYQDIWSITSDGSVLETKEDKKQIETQKYSYLYNEERKRFHEESEQKQGKPVPSFKYKITYRNALFFKEMLNIKEDIEKIMQMEPNHIMDLINEKVKNKNYENLKYDKALIFVCGNLDEAFQDAIMVDESDIDADMIHERSKKISIFDIKNALNERFRPEQIARLGNNHIIYPSLNRSAYEKIINMKINEISDKMKPQIRFNTLTFDESVMRAVYKNSVFPTQGVRPVFSTISSIENIFPKFVYKANSEGIDVEGKDLHVSYDGEGFVIKVGKDAIVINHVFNIDDVKKKSLERKAEQYRVIAVHEAGHLIGSLIFCGKIPEMASIKPDAMSGYVIETEDISFLTEKTIKEKCKLILSGTIAEDIVFGERSIGATSDLYKLSILISSKYRCGMKNFVATSFREDFNFNKGIVEPDEKYSAEVEKEIKELSDKTKHDIYEHKELLYFFSVVLFEQRNLNKKQIEEYLSKFKNGKYMSLIRKENEIVSLFDRMKSQVEGLV